MVPAWWCPGESVITLPPVGHKDDQKKKKKKNAIDVRVEAMRAEYAETSRALAKLQRDIDHKSCSLLQLRSLRRGESPSEAMTNAQLAAMNEDWKQCGAWIEWLRVRNVRCIDHDVVSLPWSEERRLGEDMEEADADADGAVGDLGAATRTTRVGSDTRRGRE